MLLKAATITLTTATTTLGFGEDTSIANIDSQVVTRGQL